MNSSSFSFITPMKLRIIIMEITIERRLCKISLSLFDEFVMKRNQ